LKAFFLGTEMSEKKRRNCEIIIFLMKFTENKN